MEYFEQNYTVVNLLSTVQVVVVDVCWQRMMGINF
jgi:hypothetical protein